MEIHLPDFVSDFARGMKLADSRGPVFKGFRPGIAPHGEKEAIQLIMTELAALRPDVYKGRFSTQVRYPAATRQKCDLCLGLDPQWSWAIEAKLLRFLGDNEKENHNMLMHILSPYPQHRSALTDCEKLRASGLVGRKAVLIYGFEHREWALEPAVSAFETLASIRVCLGRRESAAFEGLIHPIFSRGQFLPGKYREA